MPKNRITLYRAILERAKSPTGRPLRLEKLKELAWLMMKQRRRVIVPDDETMLGDGTLKALGREGVRIIGAIGQEYEFRHDQMRSFLAALWLTEETPNLLALEKATLDANAFELKREDQKELWDFLAALLTLDMDLRDLWKFASDDPGKRGLLQAALQGEADNRHVSLARENERQRVRCAQSPA